jgi:hypothetical protein
VPLKVWRLWAVDGEAQWWFELGLPYARRYPDLLKSLRWVSQAYCVALVFLFV